MARQIGKPGIASYPEAPEEESSPTADARADATLKDDPRWQLVERIITSPGFSKSPKLVGFLRFVVHRSLANLSGQINEQSIGVEVFGRPSGYDSNDDNIVRSHASRLRQRLEAYFQSEGAGEPLRISIPKGSYAPTFHEAPRVVEPNSASMESLALERPMDALVPQASTDPHPQAAEFRTPRRYWLLTLVACLACIAATYLFTNGLHRKLVSGPPEPNHALWQELLGDRRNTLVVSGDSSLVIYENIMGKTLGIAEYVSGNYRDENAPQSQIDPHMLQTIARRRLTSIVDLDIANRISHRAEAIPGRVVLRYARDLHVDDLKGSNAIFIGSQEANPWIQLYSDSLNFTIVPNQQTKVFTIHNRAPKAGEPPQYESGLGNPERRAYATIAYLRNLDGSGHVLIIQGTGMAGTEAAADYVLAQNDLSSLLHLPSSAGEALPNFEILLETSNLNGNAPRSKLLAMRINGR